MSILNEKRILVAGGTGNVGRHLVQGLLAAGATVVVPSRSAEKLDALRSSIESDSREKLVALAGDITDRGDSARLLERAQPLDGAVASLGTFVAAPSILSASREDLERTLGSYVVGHFAVARAVIPALRDRNGGYLMINGPLAYEPMFPGTGLVSIATAAQAMLARVLMRESADGPVRINELVIYSNLGRGQDGQNRISGADIGRYVAYLHSDEGKLVRGETIHLRSPDMIPAHV